MKIYRIENVVQFNFFLNQLTKSNKSIFDNFKTQLFEFLQSFSNTCSQLTVLLNYNQLSEFISIQIPKHSLMQIAYLDCIGDQQKYPALRGIKCKPVHGQLLLKRLLAQPTTPHTLRCSTRLEVIEDTNSYQRYKQLPKLKLLEELLNFLKVQIISPIL